MLGGHVLQRSVYPWKTDGNLQCSKHSDSGSSGTNMHQEIDQDIKSDS